MSTTSRLADYVIAPTMAYETPGGSFLTDVFMTMDARYGPAGSYAQYTPAIAARPPGSDLIDSWDFFRRLGERMGLDLVVSRYVMSPMEPLHLSSVPGITADELLERYTAMGRVGLAEIKRHPHGASFPQPAAVVAEPDPECTDRQRLADASMLADLRERLEEPGAPDRAFPFRLIGQRVKNAYNSSMRDPATHRKRADNPALVHPDDLAELGLQAGDEIEICSRTAVVPAVVEPDETLRRGLVSLTHGYGGLPGDDADVRVEGSSAARLLDGTDYADRNIGMPRIGNVAVQLRPRGSATT